jgi:TetR/AcrR family transcriptional regulator, cholesterol catabolism regulator
MRVGTGLLKAISGSSRLTALGSRRKENPLTFQLFNHAQPAGMLKPLIARTNTWMPEIGRGIQIKRPVRDSAHYCACREDFAQVVQVASHSEHVVVIPSNARNLLFAAMTKNSSIGNPARNCLPCHPMARETVVDSRQEILRTAARLFQQRGYDATSMNDVAAALKLSKGGLYHHFQSKDEILFEIMAHAMEITEERVLTPVRAIADPEDRLRALIRLHIEVVLSPRDREITVMLHENHPLPPALRKRINAKKKDYIHFLEKLMAEVQEKMKRKSPDHFKGRVSPRAAAFALLGMTNWIYQWYKPEGDLQANNLIPQFTELIFGGIFA